MEFAQRILFDLLVIFVAAKLAGWLFFRLGQPAFLGELLAGMLIGSHALGLIGRPGPELAAAFDGEQAANAALTGAYRTMAELGLIFLLFFVGLETRIQDIAVPEVVFAVVVVVSLVTTVIVPPALARLARGRRLAQPVTAVEGDMAQEGHPPDLGSNQRAA